MRIFVDDGSTNIKLAWVEDGAVKTLISPNSFKPEWSMTLQGLTDATVRKKYLLQSIRISWKQETTLRTCFRMMNKNRTLLKDAVASFFLFRQRMSPGSSFYCAG